MIVLGVIFSIISITKCANILGIVPIPSYSHQVVFQPIWRELSLRGHQVTTLTTDPINDPSLVNLTEIDLHFSYDVWNKVLVEVTESNQESVIKAVNVAFMTLNNITQMQLEHPEVQNLLRNEHVKFDLVMVEYFIPVMFAFAKRFNCPFIGMTSLDTPSNYLKLIGSPTHPIMNPSNFFTLSENMSFTERVTSVVVSLAIEVCINYYFFSYQQIQAEKIFGTNCPNLKELAQNASLLFMNSDPIFHKVKALNPNVIQIGGGSHRAQTKPLPEKMKSVLDSASEGVIYFSLGSNVKSKDIPLLLRNVILSAFAELPYTILWKFEDEDLPNKPNNVIVSKWFPQQDVLKHPNIKLFITQGGLQSMEESVYSHIPMVVLPFMGDQFDNAQKVVNKGLGLSLEYTLLEKNTFKKTILEVINNAEYKKKTKELAELASDQMMTGIKKAIWWSEYVIRHKGAEHLRSPVLDISLYQYYLLDVIGILILSVGVSMSTLHILFKFMFALMKYLYSWNGNIKFKKQ